MWITVAMRAAVRCPHCKALVSTGRLPGVETCTDCKQSFDMAKVFADIKRELDEDDYEPEDEEGGDDEEDDEEEEDDDEDAEPANEQDDLFLRREAEEATRKSGFGYYYDVAAEALARADGAKLHYQNTYTDELYAWRASPACACGQSIALPAPPMCTKCGAAIAIAQPDARTKLWDDRITHTIGEHAGPVAENHRFYLAYQLDELARLEMLEWLARNASMNQVDMKVIEPLLAEVRPRGQQLRRVRELKAKGPIFFDIAAELARGPLSDSEAAHLDQRLTPVLRKRLQHVAPALASRWAFATAEKTRIHAARLATDASLLERMLLDSSPKVRAMLASRELPASSFATLAADSEPEVRAAVARNTATPQDLLAKLHKDKDKEVAKTATANPKRKKGLFERISNAMDGGD